MRSRLLGMRQALSVLMLIGLLLSASACFQIVAPESAYRNRAEGTSVPTKTVTVTVTPPPATVTPPPTTAKPTAPVGGGIVGTWNLDNNTFEGTGSGIDGSIIAGGTFTNSMPGFGKALKQSGVNSYGFMAPTSPALGISTNLTIESWIKLDGLPGRSPLVSKTDRQGPEQNSYQLQVGADGHPGMSVWKNPDATTFLRGDTLLNIGQWYHLAGSYEYNGDGTSIMKVYVDGKLDGLLSDAVGPIFVGTGQFGIGKLNGAIDEVHVWNTSYPNYALAAALMATIKEPGASSNVTAYINPAVPGVKVNFEVLPGSVNFGRRASVSTNNAGVARWSYSDNISKEGVDKIRVWIDRDWSGSFEASNDVSSVLSQYWLNGFVTGSGNIMEGNRVRWTFAGSVGVFGSNVGVVDSNIVGEFELIDNVRKVTYRADTFRSNDIFFRENVQPLPAGAKSVNFIGNFVNNLDDRKIFVWIWMVDAGKPGADADRIGVKIDPSGVPGNIWIGAPNPDWTPGPAQSQYYVFTVPISSGNIQVHNIN